MGLEWPLRSPVNAARSCRTCDPYNGPLGSRWGHVLEARTSSHDIFMLRSLTLLPIESMSRWIVACYSPPVVIW
ncbi:MAG: hypothetical protein NVS4B2_04200 [Chloroflexota bacterium]